MKKQLIALLSVFTVLAGIAHAELNNPGGIGGLESLRGATEIEATRAADPMKKYPREQALESDFVYQPPLIPHNIRNYEVSLNANKLPCVPQLEKRQRNGRHQDQCHSLCEPRRCGTVGRLSTPLLLFAVSRPSGGCKTAG